MALPSGVISFAADPGAVTLSGSAVLIVTGTGGAVATSDAGKRYTLTADSDSPTGYVFTPGAASEFLLPASCVPGTAGVWSAYVVARRLGTTAQRSLITGKSVFLDYPEQIFETAGIRASHNQADNTTAVVAGPSAQSDRFVLFGGYDPAGNVVWVSQADHPAVTAAAVGRYDYPGDTRFYVGGDFGFGPPGYVVEAFGFAQRLLTLSDRETLTDHHGLRRFRQTPAGAGVVSQSQTVSGGTVSLHVRPTATTGTAEILCTRAPGSSSPIDGPVLFDGWRVDDDGEEANLTESVEWPDGFRQRVFGYAHGPGPAHLMEWACQTAGGGRDTTTARFEGLTYTEPVTPAYATAAPAYPPLYEVPAHLDFTTGRPRTTFDATASGILISIYICNPREFWADKWGVAYGQALRTAGVACEIGLPHYFDESGGAYPTWAAYWASLAGIRATYADIFAQGWGADGLVTWSGDNLFYRATGGPYAEINGDYDVTPMRVFYDRGWWPEACVDTLEWIRTLPGNHLLLSYQDEFEYRFGYDPDDGSHVNAGTAGLDGKRSIAAFMAAWRNAGGFAAGPSSFRVTGGQAAGVSGWHDPAYTDFVNQNNDWNLYGTPPLGSLPGYWVTQGYARRQRRAGVPFAVNVNTISEVGVPDGEGGFDPLTEQVAVGHRPYQLGPQIWFSLGLGATILRGYVMYPHDQLGLKESIDAPGGELHFGVRPGTALWDALLLHATAVREYTPYILQPETTAPRVSTDWFAWAREGDGRRLLCLVNLTDAARPFPAGVPVAGYTRADVIQTARTAVPPAALAGRPIPPGGAVVLTGPAAGPAPFAPVVPQRKPRMLHAPGEPYVTTLLTCDPATGLPAGDAPPAVALHRNGSATAVPVGVTPAGGPGWWRVAFTFPADWTPDDHWAVVATYAAGGREWAHVDDRGVLGHPTPPAAPCPDTDGWAGTVNCRVANLAVAVTALEDRLKGS